MVLASISECLNKIDNMIFDKNCKVILIVLEDIGTHIEWKQADVVCKGEEDFEQKIAVLSGHAEIINIKEKYYSDKLDDMNEYLDGPCNKLRQKFLEWCDVIDLRNNIDESI